MSGPELQNLNPSDSVMEEFAPIPGDLATLHLNDEALNSDRGLDFVFVPGINHCETCRQFRGQVLVDGEAAAHHVFAYSQSAITRRNALDELARRLLHDVQRLRARDGSECNRPIVFTFHDYGGAIVKKALVIASRTESLARLLANTWYLVSICSPHRWDKAADLEEKYLQVLKSKHEAYPESMTRLASVLAETTRATNAEFLTANILSRVMFHCSFSSDRDASVRIFDKPDVCTWVHGEERSWASSTHAQRVDGQVNLWTTPVEQFLKDPRREAIIRMSSPIYPPATLVPDPVQLQRLVSDPSFTAFRRRRAGITVLEAFGHNDARTAAEYIYAVFERARDLTMSGTPDHIGNDSTFFFQFDAHDTRFKDAGCMLRTVIALTVKDGMNSNLVNGIREGMAERANSGTFWTNDELYEFWIRLTRVHWSDGLWLVLGGFDQCDASSRNWFLSRLASSMAKTELPIRVAVTHNRTDSNDELRKRLADLASSNHCHRSAATGNDGQENTAGAEFPNLYSLDMDEVGFTAWTRQYETPPEPLIIRDSVRYPQTTALWSEGWEMADVRDAVAIWTEHNRTNAERLAATLLPRRLQLSFSAVSRAILDMVPTHNQRWARMAMSWLALSFRPLTVGEAAAAIGLPGQGVEEAEQPCTGDQLMDALRKHFGGLFQVVHGEVRGGPKLWEAVKSASSDSPNAASPWYCSVNDYRAHGDIMKRCLKYLCREGMKDAIEKVATTGNIWAEDSQGGTGPDTRLLVYATENWELHYRESSPSLDAPAASGSTDTDDVLSFLAEDDLREPWARAYRALTRGIARDTSGPVTVSPLQVCAMLGFNHLLRLFGNKAGTQEWQQAAMEAAAHGRLETLRSIFALAPSAGAELDCKKAIRAAMSSNNEEVILEMLPRLAPTETSCSPALVKDLLLQSSRLGHTAVVEKLLAHPWNTSERCPEGVTESLYYATRGDHLAMAKLLCNAGADVEETAKGDFVIPLAPLGGAGRYACPQVAEFLVVDCSAKTDVKFDDWTPLQWATASGCARAVRSILTRQSLAEYERDGDHPAVLAVQRGYWKVLETLCRVAGDFEMVVDGKTLLSHAVENGDFDTVQMLLMNGAKVGGSHAEAEVTLLHQAVKLNHHRMVALLVEHGADVNGMGGSEWETPLWQAADLGLSEMVEYLLEKGAEIDKKGTDGRTPLYRATWSRHEKTVELLLQRGADPEGGETEKGLRPIHVAYDSAEATKVLLQHGAKCNTLGGWGRPLVLAARNNFPDTLKVLLDDDLAGRHDLCDLEAEEDDGHTALTSAMNSEEGRDEVVLTLLDAGADVNKAVNGYTPLHQAVYRGKEALVAKMLQCRADVNARDSAGNTPLNRLQSNTPVSIAKALLNAGVDINGANDRGFTPVWTALRAGNAAVMRLLLGPRCGADVNLVSSARQGLLHWACLYATPDLVKDVVQIGGADVNMDIAGFWGTPLQAVAHRRTTESSWFSDPHVPGTVDDVTINPHATEIIRLMTLLLSKGAVLNPAAPSKGGLGYAINTACFSAPFDVVRFLIHERGERGARVNVRDSPARRTPLHIACYRDKRFVEAVLSAHPSVRNAADVAKLLSTVRDITGRLPLHYAAVTGKLDLVQFVLDKMGIVKAGQATVTGTEPEATGNGYADFRDVINQKDEQGWTPLHWAARSVTLWSIDHRRGREDYRRTIDRGAVVRLLIEHGADLGAATAKGPIGSQPHQMWTPLDVAVYHDAPQDVLEALAVPVLTDAGKAGVGERKESTVKAATQHTHAFCDCCLLAVVGTAYKCTECWDFLLCFTCHNHRGVLHPPQHGAFIDIGLDDDLDDGPDEKETHVEEDTERLPNNERPPSSHGGGAEIVVEEKTEEVQSSPPAAFDGEWRWEVEEGGDIMLTLDGSDS
ncbi:hypothetical protein VTI28DRAFT_6003 [Corynascus sepedonium]